MIFILEDNDERIAGFQRELGDIKHHIERTVPESIAWLTQNEEFVSLYSLDNDLLVLDFEGDEGEGWQLCEWILANAPQVPIISHTTNGHAGTKMQMACDDAGWPFRRIVPYNAFEWIGDSWIHAVKDLIC